MLLLSFTLLIVGKERLTIKLIDNKETGLQDKLIGLDYLVTR